MSGIKETNQLCISKPTFSISRLYFSQRHYLKYFKLLLNNIFPWYISNFSLFYAYF